MEIGSLKNARATMENKGLDDDERLVLAALVEAGYDEEGKPRGHEGKLSANALAQVIYLSAYDTETLNWNEEKTRIESCKRRVRDAVNGLIIRRDISICCQAGSGGGYYLPANQAEVENNHKAFHRRAMTGLVKAARGRKAAYADAMVQLTLGFETEAQSFREGAAESPSGDDEPPAWVGVVTGLLEQVRGDPEKYAAEIKRIQDDFGDIFVRRDQVAKIKQLSSELNKVLDALQA
jgi:hypothetical protein